jgi:hypothetical protein
MLKGNHGLAVTIACRMSLISPSRSALNNIRSDLSIAHRADRVAVAPASAGFERKCTVTSTRSYTAAWAKDRLLPV